MTNTFQEAVWSMDMFTESDVSIEWQLQCLEEPRVVLLWFVPSTPYPLNCRIGVVACLSDPRIE